MRAIALLAVGALLALFYVWLDMKAEALGEKIVRLESEAAEAQRRYEHELWKWECAISPSNIEEALNRFEMVMVWPEDENVIRMRKPGVSLAELNAKPSETKLLALSKMPVRHD